MRDYQLDIYGNWKPVVIVNREPILDKRYEAKLLREKKNRFKKEGVIRADSNK